VLCVVEKGADVYCFCTLVIVPSYRNVVKSAHYHWLKDTGLVDRVVMIFFLSSIHVCRRIPMEIFPSGLLSPCGYK